MPYNAKKIIFLSIFIFLISGCRGLEKRVPVNFRHAEKKINCFINPNLKTHIKKVLVIPPVNYSSQANIEQQVYEALILMLSGYNYFETVKYNSVPEKIVKQLQKFYLREDINGDSLEQLKLFCADSAIDAVIFSEIVFFRAYKPMLFGYKHVMIEFPSLNVVWSVDDQFDMARKEIDLLSRNWYNRNHDANINPGFKGDIMEFSMSNFITFAFEMIGHTWQTKNE